MGLNPGYHRHLRAAAAALRPLPRDRGAGRTGAGPVRLLDLGCGSGASTRALLDVLVELGEDLDVTGVDASAGMLARARAKSWPDGVRFVHGRAEELRDGGRAFGLRGPLGGVLAAYLFRNVPAGDRDDVVRAAYAALEPGGTLVAQEYSVAGSRRAALTWSVVCWLVVIPLSWLTSRDTRLYRYLWRSVLAFDTTTVFADRLRRAGFADVEVRRVGGWQRGILHTFRARRPVAAAPAGPGSS